MTLKAKFKKHTLQFTFDAGTSRGTMKTRTTWFLFLWNETEPAVKGIGEAAPLPGLSLEPEHLMDRKLQEICACINEGQVTTMENVQLIPNLKDFPSLLFALEIAFLDLSNGGKKVIFNNGFALGKKQIPINGLVWMGNERFMMDQVQQKIEEGYTCIKLKIGALDFEKELKILQSIRNSFTENEITLRLDANGAFAPEEAIEKLNQLASFQIHSIEQPIRAGQKEMAALCRESPIPIALDEELIGKVDAAQKASLLQEIRPAYIILKPSLLGGIESCNTWKQIAASLGISWWATSALESNIGLNAIAQWTANEIFKVPQGLGTGKLYHNNIFSPLYMHHGYLGSDPSIEWQKEIFQGD